MGRRTISSCEKGIEGISTHVPTFCLHARSASLGDSGGPIILSGSRLSISILTTARKYKRGTRAVRIGMPIVIFVKERCVHSLYHVNTEPSVGVWVLSGNWKTVVTHRSICMTFDVVKGSFIQTCSIEFEMVVSWQCSWSQRKALVVLRMWKMNHVLGKSPSLK